MIASAALAASLLMAPVTPGVSDAPVPVNLDRDASIERLLYHQRSSDSAFQARVRDRCGASTRTWRLSPYENKFNVIEAVEADGTTAQPEVWFDATGLSGALTDRLVKLVRFDQADGACARPHTLFRYRPRPARDGRGTTVIGSRLVEADPSRPGLEIRLRLATFETADGEPHGTGRETRLFGYSAPADRYVRLRVDRLGRGSRAAGALRCAGGPRGG